jgi:AraC family cel operon transcriptional repressor
MNDNHNEPLFAQWKSPVSRKEYQKMFEHPEGGLRFHYWYNGSTNKHSHDFYELFIILQGPVQHVYNGQTSILTENTLCLVKPDDVHQFLKMENAAAKHFNVSITPPLFHSICSVLDEALYSKLNSTGEFICYHLHDGEAASLLQTLNLLNTADESNREQHVAIVKAFIVNALLYLQPSLKTEKVFPEWFSDFLNKVHTPDYFLRPIHELYALVPYSQPRLNAYFHEYVGGTLVAYVTKLKINYACSLLRYSNYSVLQVAEMAAYNNLSHFNHTFKRLIGCSPKQYRTRF